MRVGLVGYGRSGRWCHAPFIDATHDLELVGVATAAPSRVVALAQDRPGVAAVDSLSELLELGLDAVVIASPPSTRVALAHQALQAGVHVVVDPLTSHADDVEGLQASAEAADLRLAVYHHRRYDADIQTVRQIVKSGRLGSLWQFHSRFDIDDPEALLAGPHGGLVRGLGAHLIDQVLWLFGPVVRVHAHLDHLDTPDGPVDCAFVLTLDHAAGGSSFLSGSAVNRVAARTLRAYGSAGSYRASSSDVQMADLVAGRSPLIAPECWGYEPPPHWGHLDTASGTETVASEQGRYHEFYGRFVRAITTSEPVPVGLADAIEVRKVLAAVTQSALESAVIEL